MVLKDIAYYVDASVSSDSIELKQYVTTDSLLQNKEGKTDASNLPPQPCSLTHFLPEDVLVANIRPYLKKVWMADIEGGCSKDVLVIRAKGKHNAEYIYALSLQDTFFENAMLGKKGTQMPRGDKDKIMEYPVLGHCEDDERKVGHIISCIQRKIIHNTRINAELEAMAKQLYDYWFVQFDFPDENGKPYKSSGGMMVYNEKLKRDIPEGWEIKTIDQIAKTPKTSINPYEYPDKIFKHYSIPAYDECGTFLHENGTSIQSNKYVVNKGQILAPKLNPWYNRIILVDNSEDSICSTEYVILDPVEKYIRGFLYYLVKTGGFVTYCTKGSTGTSHSQRRVPPDVLKSYTFPFNRKIVESYTSCILPQIEIINQNLNENKQLMNLRDLLLPMLMNGQVTVE